MRYMSRMIDDENRRKVRDALHRIRGLRSRFGGINDPFFNEVFCVLERDLMRRRWCLISLSAAIKRVG